MPFAAPFMSSVHNVEDQWIDYNGHFNMAYYNVLFDRAGAMKPSTFWSRRRLCEACQLLVLHA